MANGDIVRYAGGNKYDVAYGNSERSAYYETEGLTEGGNYESLGERADLGEPMIGLCRVRNIWRPSRWFVLVRETSQEDREKQFMRYDLQRFLEKFGLGELQQLLIEELDPSRRVRQ